jgi:hypothetical protein
MNKIDLFSLLSRFENIDDVETDIAFYRTKVPSVAPMAYLNIVYKATTRATVEEHESALHLPPELVEFYRQWNGARLFVGRMSIFGCIPNPHPLFKRQDPLAYLPFDLRLENGMRHSELLSRNLLCVGVYTQDTSLVCMRRHTSEVICTMGKDLDRVRAQWPSFREWLSAEVPRVAACFDERGNLAVPPAFTLPGTTPTATLKH